MFTEMCTARITLNHIRYSHFGVICAIASQITDNSTVGWTIHSGKQQSLLRITGTVWVESTGDRAMRPSCIRSSFYQRSECPPVREQYSGCCERFSCCSLSLLNVLNWKWNGEWLELVNPNRNLSDDSMLSYTHFTQCPVRNSWFMQAIFMKRDSEPEWHRSRRGEGTLSIYTLDTK